MSHNRADTIAGENTVTNESGAEQPAQQHHQSNTPTEVSNKTVEAERFISGWISNNQLTIDDIRLMKEKMDEMFARQCQIAEQTNPDKDDDALSKSNDPVELKKAKELENEISKEAKPVSNEMENNLDAEEGDCFNKSNGETTLMDIEVEKTTPIASLGTNNGKRKKHQMQVTKLQATIPEVKLYYDMTSKISFENVMKFMAEGININKYFNDTVSNAARKKLYLVKNKKKEKVVVKKIKDYEYGWNHILSNQVPLNKIHSTYKEIFEMYDDEKVQGIDDRKTIKVLRNNMESHMLQVRVPEMQFCMIKAYFKLSFMCKDLSKTTPMVDARQMQAIYGLVHSNTDYYKQFDRSDNLLEPCINYIKSNLNEIDRNHRLFPFVLDSMLKIIELTGHQASESQQLWSMVSLHLETYTKGVRHRLLKLFEYIVGDKVFLSSNILVDVLVGLTWFNPTKYELLAVIFKKYKYDELQLLGTKCEQHLRPEVFFKGLVIALQHDNLADVSRKLLAELCKSPATVGPLFIPFLVDILENGSIKELENLEKHWEFVTGSLSMYEYLEVAEKTYEVITQTDDFQYLRDENYQRLVVFRLLFHPEITRYYNFKAIDQLIVHKCTDLNYLRDLSFKIWTKNIYEDRATAMSLIYLVKLVRKMVDDDYSRFIERELFDLLLFLAYQLPDTADNGLELVKAGKHRIAKALLDIESICLDGIYGVKCTARLQLLLVFLDLFANTYWHDKAIYKMLQHPQKENGKLKKVLSNVLNKFLLSENDNVRAMALKITKKHLTGPSVSRLYPVDGEGMNFEARCHEYNTKQENIHYVKCSDQFAALYIEEKARKANQFFAHCPVFSQIQVAKIDRLFPSFKCDPFKVVMSGHHYFGHVNALLKFFDVQHEKYEIGQIANTMQEQLDNSTICDTYIEIINTINPHGTANNKNGPSSSITEKSIAKIIRDSEYSSQTPIKDAEYFERSMLESLKGYCKLTASLANYYLRFTKDIEEITIQAKTALIQHYSVLARCYDPETNKCVGESLGTIVGEISELFSTSPSQTRKLYESAMMFLIKQMIDTSADIAKLMKPENCNGMCEMFYQVCKNDATPDELLMRRCLYYILPEIDLKGMPQRSPSETSQLQSYKAKVPVHFKQLTRVIQDPDMAERMAEFMSQCWKLVFEKFKSTSSPDQSVVDLYNAICVRLAHQHKAPTHNNQKATNIALDHLFTKYPSIWQYILKNAGQQQALDEKILDFLSQFEYRNICSDRPQSKAKGPADKKRQGNQPYRDLHQRIADKKWQDDNIERLLRKFAIQLEKIEDLGEIVQNKVISLVGRKGKNNGKLLDVYSVTHGMHRYESNMTEGGREIYLEKLRVATLGSYSVFQSKLKYSTRSEMLEVLFDLCGFSVHDAPINDLLCSVDPTANAQETKQWQQKLSEMVQK